MSRQGADDPAADVFAHADRRVRAAGAVLWQADDAHRRLLAVIHRPRYDDWSLPKGKLDPGEDDAAAALREIREETGQGAEILRDLGEVRYLAHKNGQAIDKTVRYFEMHVTDPGRFVADDEVDDLRWVSVDDARATVTYDEDREVLRRYEAGAGR